MSTKAIAGTTTRTISASGSPARRDESPPPSNARRNDAPPSSRSSATSTPSTGWATTAIALTPPRTISESQCAGVRGATRGVGISDRGEHLYPAWHMIDEDAICNRSGTASPSRCAGSRRDARVSRHHPRAARDPQIATRGLFDRDSWLQERDDETRSATRRSTVDCSRLNRGLPFDGDYVGKPMLSVLSA